MDLKEQYKNQHATAISAVEKLANSLAPIGGAAKMSPEVGMGGGGVGVGFNSPYVTLKVSATDFKPTSREAAVAHQMITQGTTAEKGIAHAVAETLNAHVGEAQNINAGRLVRANGDSININLEALSAGIRNNPRLEGLMENFGQVVEQTMVMQMMQMQQAAQGGPEAGAQKPAAPAAQERPVKKNPIGFAAPSKDAEAKSWASGVQDKRAQAEGQERGR